MSYRYDDLAPGEIYHIYTRGVEHRDIFLDDADRKRFMTLLIHCLPRTKVTSLSLVRRQEYKPELTQSGAGLIDLMAYCLMTNHIHLLVKENFEGGTALYMKRVLTSYACYFNKRRKRSGSLFIHPFKAVLVNGDDQFLHTSRYIHLNPFVAHMISDVLRYQWSSLADYLRHTSGKAKCHKDLLTSMMSPREYCQFVLDKADYARSLADIQHLLVDNED